MALYRIPVGGRKTILKRAEYGKIAKSENCCCGISECCCERTPGPSTVSLTITFSGGTFPTDPCACLDKSGLSLPANIADGMGGFIGINPCGTPAAEWAKDEVACGSPRIYAVECGSGGTWEVHVGSINIPLTILSCNPIHATGSTTIPGSTCGGGGTVNVEAEVVE